MPIPVAYLYSTYILLYTFRYYNTEFQCKVVPMVVLRLITL